MPREDALAHEIMSRPLSCEVLSLMLRSGGPVQPSGVSESLRRKLPSISRTLSRLERLGAVESTAEGRSKFYAIPASKRKRIDGMLKDAAGSLPRQFTRRGYVMQLQERVMKELIATHLSGYTVESDAEIQNTTMSRRGAVPDLIIRKQGTRIGLELVMGSAGLERKDMLMKLFHLVSALDYDDIQALILIVFGGTGKRAESAFEEITREKGNKFRVIRIDDIPARIDKQGALVIEEDRLGDVLLPRLAEALGDVAAVAGGDNR